MVTHAFSFLQWARHLSILATDSTAFTIFGFQKSMVEDLLNSASEISVAMLLERVRLKIWQFPHILAGMGVSSPLYYVTPQDLPPSIFQC